MMIRPFHATEWAIFRDFRLQAFKIAPEVFSTTYAVAEARTPEEWQRTIQGRANQAFGLFDAECLIGITAVFTLAEDASGETALLGMSFILPEYRGRGLSRLLYETRLSWIRTHGHFKRAVVSHRDSNEVSRRANRRYGFLLTHSAPRVWPDGKTEDEIFYELKIEPIATV
jgi:GNAT superfamily N-acetyltransferase